MKPEIISKIDSICFELGGYSSLIKILPLETIIDIALFERETLIIRPWKLKEPIFLDLIGYRKGTKANIVNELGECLYSFVASTVELISGTYQLSSSATARPCLGFLDVEKRLFWSVNNAERLFLWFPTSTSEEMVQIIVSNKLTSAEKNSIINHIRSEFNNRDYALTYNELLIQPAPNTSIKLYFMPGTYYQNLTYDQIKNDRKTFVREYNIDEVAYLRPNEPGWFVLEKVSGTSVTPTVLTKSGTEIIKEGINTDRIIEGKSGTYYIGHVNVISTNKTFKPIEENECPQVNTKKTTLFKILCYAQ